MACGRDAAEVAELDVEVALGCPAAVVAELLQAQLVGPHLDALHRAAVVAHTDHNGLHLAQGGVAHDADAVAGVGVVVAGEELVEAGRAEAFLLVAFLLEVGEHVHVDVYHVLRGPYFAAGRGRHAVVVAFGGNAKGNFVFVEVALVVAAQAQEYAGLAVLQVGDVVHQRIGVDVELEVLVLAHVVVAVLVDSLGIARRQVFDHQGQGLLVLLHQLALSGVGVALDAWGQDVVDRLLAAVLLDADGADGHGGTLGRGFAGVEGLLVAAPVTVHQVEGGQANDDGLLAVGEEHADEADAGEVVDVAHLRLVALQGDAEEIPVDLLLVAVAQGGGVDALVDDVVAPDDEVLGAYGDVVLEVLLVFVQGVVDIQVLDVGRSLIGCLVALGRVLRVGRVALGHVDALVAVEDALACLVEVAAAIVVVVVACGVGIDGVEDLCVDLPLHLLQVLGIGAELAFLFRVQTVQTDVLGPAGSAFVVEGVGDAGGCGHASPDRLGVVRLVAIQWHSAFEIFLAVLQDVLRHFAQVDVEVGSVIAGLVAVVDEGVEHPEFEVLDVHRLEVGVVHLAHHAAPLLAGFQELTVLVDVGREVVGTALLGIVGQVEHGQRRGRVVAVLGLLGIELALVDFADVVVRELVEVALDVAGRQRAAAAREQRVHIVPGQQGAVHAIADVVGQFALREHRGRAGLRPVLRGADALLEG